MLTVYGDRKSGNCLKVAWVAAHLGIDLDWREVDILKGETRTPGFLALNPDGRVPTLVLEDGRSLSESNAIIGFLARDSALGRELITAARLSGCVVGPSGLEDHEWRGLT